MRSNYDYSTLQQSIKLQILSFNTLRIPETREHEIVSQKDHGVGEWVESSVEIRKTFNSKMRKLNHINSFYTVAGIQCKKKNPEDKLL